MTFCRKECNSYRRYPDILGQTIGRCLGTKEIELCDCGGDESKCDFYPERRKKSKKPKKPSFYDIIQELIEENFELTIQRGSVFEDAVRVSVRDNKSGQVIEGCLRQENSPSYNYEEALLEKIYLMIYYLKE